MNKKYNALAYMCNMLYIVFVLDAFTLEDIISEISSSMSPKLVVTNTTQIQSFLTELLALKDAPDASEVYKSMKILDVTVKTDNSKIYQIISDRDFTAFKNATPDCTHSHFFKLDNIVNEKI